MNKYEIKKDSQDGSNSILGEDSGEKKDKPIKAKPVFYACCYEPLKAIAKEMGYNLLINGSLNRDMDLVAIAWSDDPKPMKEVVVAFDKYLRGIHYSEESIESGYMYSVLPGGRHSFIINLNRGGRWNQYLDEQWYVDISFTPIPEKPGSAFEKTQADGQNEQIQKNCRTCRYVLSVKITEEPCISCIHHRGKKLMWEAR